MPRRVSYDVFRVLKLLGLGISCRYSDNSQFYSPTVSCKIFLGRLGVTEGGPEETAKEKKRDEKQGAKMGKK
jgi:hypothetical protein